MRYAANVVLNDEGDDNSDDAGDEEDGFDGFDDEIWTNKAHTFHLLCQNGADPFLKDQVCIIIIALLFGCIVQLPLLLSCHSHNN